jgi:hypothetical protein
VSGLERFQKREKMTLKPSERILEDEREENSSPNSPETNEETDQSTENQNPTTPNRLTFFVGQQLDVLDSVNYWTEAEVKL